MTYRDLKPWHTYPARITAPNGVTYTALFVAVPDTITGGDAPYTHPGLRPTYNESNDIPSDVLDTIAYLFNEGDEAEGETYTGADDVPSARWSWRFNPCAR